MDGKAKRAARLFAAVSLAGVAAAWTLLVPASAGAEPHLIPSPALTGVPSLPGPVAAPAQPASQGLGLLRTTPETVTVGSKFTVTGDGLPANKDIDILWSTANAGYLMDASSENVMYYGRQIDPLYVVLGHATTDAGGKLSVQLTVPEDYGNLHDIYAVADGLQLAKGGLLVNRTASISPTEGPVGTTITIKLAALGYLVYEDTVAVLYDNHYVGYISSTTTRGVATVRIRAAGGVGTHVIELDPSSHAVPFLDVDQSATYYNRQFRFTFKVTADNGPPKPSVEWPEAVQPTVSSRTGILGGGVSGVSASLTSETGPVLSKVGLKAGGLTPGAPVTLYWSTAEGTRARASGWSVVALPLGQATPAADGSLATTIQVPDNLGGWHGVQLFQNGKLQAEVPYYVSEKLVGVSPGKVKAGDVVHVRVKGVGWTELDNGFSVVYDNSFIGYACGFFSKGYVDLKLVATGKPGTHLVDLYPMIYKGKGSDLWNNEVPMLSFAQDSPGLALGYRLPAIRVAFQVIK